MYTLVKNAIMVDGSGAAARPETTVLIKGSQIISIGGNDLAAPTGETVCEIDASGKTLIPGLMDVHTHLLGGSAVSSLDDVTRVAYGVSNCSRVLRHGITTIRDAGTKSGACMVALKRGLKEGWYPGPDIHASGEAICMTGGHSYNGVAVEADGVEGVRQMARKQLRDGSDWVKLMATGGAAGLYEKMNSVQLDEDELRAAVREAHKAGKRAMAHAMAPEGIMNALNAGIDCIEHGIVLDQQCIDTMLERDVYLIPTVSVYPRIVECADTHKLPRHLVEKAKEVIELHMESMQKAAVAGVKMGLGSDTAGGYHQPGDLGLEFERMGQIGLSNIEVIKAATASNAHLLGIDDQYGTIATGKIADLVILSGDILSDLRQVESVMCVLKAGKIVHMAPGATSCIQSTVSQKTHEPNARAIG